MIPTIYFTELAWKKINGYIKLSADEISGLGRATIVNGDIIVSDIFLWKQENSGATTEVVDHAAVFNLAEKLEKDGVPMEEMCVWWHSHASMAAFFSGVDKQTIEEWLNDRVLVAVVGNKAGQFKGTIAVKGGPIPYTIEDVPVEYFTPEDVSMEGQLKKDIADNVVVKTYPRQMGFVGDYGQGYQPYQFTNKGKKKKRREEPIEMAEEDWTALENDSAGECMCADCDDFLMGRRAAFAYETHIWSGKRGLYIRMNGHGQSKQTTITDLSTIDDDDPTTWNPNRNPADYPTDYAQ